MRIIHVIPCIDATNGICRVAYDLAKRQSDDGHQTAVVTAKEFTGFPIPEAQTGEVWVHGMWLPCEWRACMRAIGMRSRHGWSFVRMTHGSLSPICLERQGKWKKLLVAPIERWLFSKADRVVTTGEWEVEWCRQWGLKNEFQIVDLRQFFKLDAKCELRPGGLSEDRPLRVLYLGRQHPLKGIGFLECAVREINDEWRNAGENGVRRASAGLIELKEVSDAQGKELENIWEWCDVLCLPTLSENFGRVVAEALERGRPAITTDGAPAWASEAGRGVIYLRGYREGSDTVRVRLLKKALMELIGNSGVGR